MLALGAPTFDPPLPGTLPAAGFGTTFTGFAFIPMGKEMFKHICSECGGSFDTDDKDVVFRSSMRVFDIGAWRCNECEWIVPGTCPID